MTLNGVMAVNLRYLPNSAGGAYYVREVEDIPTLSVDRNVVERI